MNVEDGVSIACKYCEINIVYKRKCDGREWRLNVEEQIYREK